MVLDHVGQSLVLHASNSSRGTLLEAYCLGILQDLRRQSPAIDILAKNTCCYLQPPHLLAWMIQQGGDWQSSIENHPDYPKIISLILERESKFPTRSSPLHYLLCQHQAPQAAEGMQKKLLADQLKAFDFQLLPDLYPHDAARLMEVYFYLLATRQHDQATQLFQSARTQGIPLPVL